jgi:rhodanese-related sulfurtransferase
MNTLKALSASFIILALVLVLIPGSGYYSFVEEPEELAHDLSEPDAYLPVDRVARFVVSEDSTVQLIDLRDSLEFMRLNIPGAMNIPLERFFKMKPETFLFNKDVKYIFYSNGDIKSSYALSLARGLGYSNCFAVEGGLNSWFEIIMNSSFTGDIIGPRENAKYENRLRARRFFTEINSLPDSLKLQYAESRRQAEKNLDGGCE